MQTPVRPSGSPIETGWGRFVTSMPSRSGFNKRFGSAGLVWARCLAPRIPSYLMTNHVDAELLGERVRSMGCEVVAGRAELAPQIVQEVEDIVAFVDDSPSRLTTASVSE